MTAPTHVDPQLLHWFERSNDERAAFILADSYVPYAWGTKILSASSEIIHGPRRERPRCMLVVGEPGFGKSTLMTKIVSSNRRRPSSGVTRCHPTTASSTNQSSMSSA